jgi:VanZ family protein
MALRTSLRLWLPPLALMVVIFYLSDQPDLSSGLGIVDLLGRKVVHAAEYALLCALWWRALRPAAPSRVALVASLTVSIAYAVSDEVHQSFVPGRTGTPIDVSIDAAGAGLAALVIRRRERRPAGLG